MREITERHAEKLIELLDTVAVGLSSGKDCLLDEFGRGLLAYAEDFGQPAADRLEAYVRRQASLDSQSRRQR